jgi:hypothetical protein
MKVTHFNKSRWAVVVCVGAGMWSSGTGATILDNYASRPKQPPDLVLNCSMSSGGSRVHSVWFSQKICDQSPDNGVNTVYCNLSETSIDFSYIFRGKTTLLYQINRIDGTIVVHQSSGPTLTGQCTRVTPGAKKF